jgi:4-hydroxy-3-polyprenylbenzoate decarboxylase
MENAQIAAVIARVMLPLLQLDLPWVHDLHMPVEGIFHRATLVAMDSCPLAMRDVGRALWQTALLEKARLIVLLDSDTDVKQTSQVYWRIVNISNWNKHLLIEHDRLIIDARWTPRAGKVGPDQATLDKVLARWGAYGLR